MVDIDATGEIVNKFTHALNNKKDEIEITKQELLQIFSENGQVFEFVLSIKNTQNYRIIIRDGNSADILGDKEMIPVHIIGNFRKIDINFFG